MDLDEAIRKAVLAFYTKNDFATNYEKSSGKKVRHNKQFFDDYEEELRGRKKKVKKPKEEADQLEEMSEGEE